MKKLYVPLAVLMMLCLSSCEVVDQLFKIAFIVGVFSFVIFIGIVVWFLSLFRSKSEE